MLSNNNNINNLLNEYHHKFEENKNIKNGCLVESSRFYIQGEFEKYFIREINDNNNQ